MPIAWSIVVKLAELVPDILSSIGTLKKQQAETSSRVEVRIAEMERTDTQQRELIGTLRHTVTQQHELIEKLTRHVDSLQPILRQTRIISIVAFVLSLIGLGWLLILST